MKKKILAIVLVVAFLCSACTDDGNRTNEISEGFQIYYLNPDLNEIVPCEYTLASTSTEKKVEECLKQLTKSPDKKSYTAPILPSIVLKEYTVSNGKISMDFSETYGNLSVAQEVLIRAAIVKTLVQIPEIEYVTFTIEGAPLRDAKDNVVGVMSKDSFVNNVGEQTNSIESYEITLYYATEDGSALKAEKRTVYASTSISMEKLVLSYLMKTPENSQLQCVIPEGTKIISVATLDGVCLVNFDETFLKYNYQVSEDAAFYSIINTLCEITGVNKVQISVNGNTDLKFRDKYSLEKLYERNLDCVQKEE